MNLKEYEDKLDIVEFIGQYIQLQQSGSVYKGVCIFHLDSNPSLAVYPETKTWHCYGCKAGGDFIAFYKRYHGVNFYEACEELGIENKKEESEPKYSNELIKSFLEGVEQERLG